MNDPRILGSEVRYTIGIGYGHGSCTQDPVSFTIRVAETQGILLVYLYSDLETEPFKVYSDRDITDQFRETCYLLIRSNRKEGKKLVLCLLESLGGYRSFIEMREIFHSERELSYVRIVE
jgi:hypothetical protein